MKNKEDIKFEIDQLRKDKMIYALESIAFSLVFFVSMLFFGTMFPTQITAYILTGAFVLVLLYWLFTVFGNTGRLIKIKKLEKLLKK